MTTRDKQGGRGESSPLADKPGQKSADVNLGKAKPDHMTKDGKSIEAGSGNTLGDGMTAGGAEHVAERRKLQD